MPVEAEADRSGRGIVLATGTAAVLLAVAMIVALNPPRSSSPLAVTATTIAIANNRGVNSPREAAVEGSSVVRNDQNSMALDRTGTLQVAVGAISTSGVGNVEDYEPATTMPAPNASVIVIVPSFVSEIDWGEIDTILPLDHAVVVSHDGELIAIIDAGDLRLVVR